MNEKAILLPDAVEIENLDNFMNATKQDWRYCRADAAIDYMTNKHNVLVVYEFECGVCKDAYYMHAEKL